MAELLPWMFLADDGGGVVACKDSSLLAVWEIGGLDIESAEDNALIALGVQMDDVLRRVGDLGVRYWSFFLREPHRGYPRAEIDNPIADFIDQRWGEQIDGGTLYRNRHYIALAMPASAEAGASIGEMTREYIDAGKSPPVAAFLAIKNSLIKSNRFAFKTPEELALQVRRFESNVCRVLQDAASIIAPRRLRGSELLGVLKATVSCNPVAPVGENPREYLDAYLCDTSIDNQHADYLVFEGKKRSFAAVLTLKSAPAGGLLQRLNPVLASPVRMRVSCVWTAYSIKETEKYLTSSRQFAEFSQMRLKRLLRQAAAAAQNPGVIDDDPTTKEGVVAEDLRSSARAKEGIFGAIAASVVVFSDSPKSLEVDVEIVSRALEATGFVFHREREGAVSGFCVGIPGHMREIVRWHFVEACTATDTSTLISLDSGDDKHPFFSEVAGHDVPPCATFQSRYGTVQYFNYHEGQLGHTLLVGPSRNGKTVWQMFMETQFLKYKNARIFNLDKDLSCKPTTLLLGGTHIDLDPSKGGGLRLNPIGLVDQPGGISWLVGWIDRLLAGRGDPLADHEMEIVAEALGRIKGYPGVRLSTLAGQLPESLRVRLAPWLEGGAMGQYFDHAVDDFRLDFITTVEVGSLLNAGLFDVVRAFAEYAFYRIETSLMDRPMEEMGPTLIYFEEAGFLLEDPIFARKAKDYLMTLAKKRAFLVMTAQSPETFTNQPILAAAVRDNVATVIFLPNMQAARPDLRSKYRQVFGLTDTQIDFIAGAVSKREYCVYKPQRGLFRIMQAQFPPDILVFLRSDADSQAVLNRYYDPSDPEWKRRYVEALLPS
jgi:type IV secretion system protein VirB4